MKIKPIDLELHLSKLNRDNPPSGGSSVSKPIKTKTIEKYDCNGKLVEKTVIKEE
jgi:hypothetical protein